MKRDLFTTGMPGTRQTGDERILLNFDKTDLTGQKTDETGQKNGAIRRANKTKPWRNRAKPKVSLNLLGSVSRIPDSQQCL